MSDGGRELYWPCGAGDQPVVRDASEPYPPPSQVTSLGTGKLGFPAGVLNLFWGVLLWKRKAEEALEASGMTYTIVRPGGKRRAALTKGVSLLIAASRY